MVTQLLQSANGILGSEVNDQPDLMLPIQARVRKVERMHLLADVSKLKSIGWQPLVDIDGGIKTLVEVWQAENK